MKNGREEYNSDLLDSLSKKHQIFLDSPNGEIMCYLVLNNKEEENLIRNEEKSRQHTKNLNNIGSFNNVRSESSFGSFNNKTNYGNENRILQSNNSISNIQNFFSDSGMII